MATRAHILLPCLSLLLSPALAAAAPGGDQPPPDTVELDPTIVGGQDATVCQWPTAVALVSQLGLCTGTLVHPRVVLMAAHCGTDFTEAVFGERASASFNVAIERCERNSTADQVGPADYGFCILAEAMTQVPLTPVVYGCEGDLLTAGREVAIAGFGEDENQEFGIKRWAMTSIAGFDGGMIRIGGGGTGPWFGDSGGPAYVQMADGSWRAFGIVSGGPGPGQAAYYVDMRSVVRFVEDRSGIDITPCHGQDGVWQPTPDCGSFATQPTSADSWFDHCGRNDPRSAPSTTCGASFVPDENDPQVRIVAPEDGHIIDEFPAEVTITVEATDDSAVRAVRLAVDGEVMQERLVGPWTFSGTFPKGTYELTALAEDVSLNAAQSDEHMLYVGEEPSGCLCRAAGGPGVADGLIGFAVLLLLRRRRQGARGVRLDRAG
jgi:hypothetical protein